jgi:hypothetical protein
MPVRAVTVFTPILYDTVDKFRKDYNKHRFAPNSQFDIDARKNGDIQC